MKRNKRGIKTLAAALAALLLMTCTAPALAETFSAIVTSKSMAVYGEASMTRKLGTLKKNAVVTVSGYSINIAKISYKGSIGYAKISDMKRVDDVAQKAVLNASAPVFQTPGGDGASVTAPAGTKLYVLAESGDWAQVERGGIVGYVKTGYLTKTDDSWETAPAAANPTDAQSTQESGITVRSYDAVTVKTVKIYKKANARAKVLGKLKSGIQVMVRATSSDGWAYIELNGRKGYCKLSGLKEGKAEDYGSEAGGAAAVGQKGAVSADSLPVYDRADTSGKLLGTLKQGQQVSVINWNSEWAYIELNGNYGFCAVTGLARADAEATPAPTYVPSTANAKTGTVVKGSLPVYRTASSRGAKLGTLKKGQTVNVLQTNEGWAYIELNGKYGFCKASGLSVAKDSEGVPAGYRQAEFTATVVIPDARVYAAANTGAENVKVKQGEEVQVVAYNDTWACVKQGSSYGFIAVKALSKAEYKEVSGDGSDLQTLLKALLSGGYYDGVPSASYNAAAISAIKRFQSACGMEQTGVADQAMLRIVYSGYAPASSLLYSSLSSGDKGDNVSRVQARLYALGYLTKTSSLSGEYGSTTAAAVKLFQSANGISDSGSADANTLKALYSTGAKSLPVGTKAADAGSSGGSSSSSSTYLDSVPNGLASTTSEYNASMSNAEKLEHTIYLAQSKLGRPYVYGATGPEKFDCSGLTTWIFKAVGVSLKRSAYAQGYDDTYEKIEGVPGLRRGDIVFFNTISDSDLSDHAGVYIGDGYFIHASSGAHRVVVSNLTTGFYKRVYSWGRRILK